MKRVLTLCLVLLIAASALAIRPYVNDHREAAGTTDFGVNVTNAIGSEMVATVFGMIADDADVDYELIKDGSVVADLTAPAGIPVNFTGASFDSVYVDRTTSTAVYIGWGIQ